jgi:hypothetical protein
MTDGRFFLVMASATSAAALTGRPMVAVIAAQNDKNSRLPILNRCSIASSLWLAAGIRSSQHAHYSCHSLMRTILITINSRSSMVEVG